MRTYAGFWLRLWAYLIDLLIVASLSSIIIHPLFAFLFTPELAIGVFTIQGVLLAVSYYVYFVVMTKVWQQTLGKMVFGLKVERTDEQRLVWKDVFIREVAGRIIHRVLWITNILYIVVAVHPEKAGIHDLLSDTRVVLER
ncbi:RDD family protein [Geomicrobium sediminis]|uniref:RDD family membrane protein YckC n=1 Tax=Geomicrobium sediminis TaxID=1347788 RepID=A0ABS2P6L3_9BACL|nr:RDD family protein [Geomicrobium sediminis]MBM7630957.1 putative RDD family membrane protein YckC [Geomicrobium sediminis]